MERILHYIYFFIFKHRARQPRLLNILEQLCKAELSKEPTSPSKILK